MGHKINLIMDQLIFKFPFSKKYFKQDFKFDMDRIFTDRKSKIGLALESFKGGQGGIGPFADPEREFVDYTNL